MYNVYIVTNDAVTTEYWKLFPRSWKYSQR